MNLTPETQNEAERLAHEVCTFYAKKYGGAGPYYLDGQHVASILATALTLAEQRGRDDALASVKPVAGWQPIESAPKDGTWIFGYWPTMSITQYPRVIFADDCSEHDIWYMPDNLDFGCVYPTHWMPLPSCPTDKV